MSASIDIQFERYGVACEKVVRPLYIDVNKGVLLGRKNNKCYIRHADEKIGFNTALK